jgi:hypothetical protein
METMVRQGGYAPPSPQCHCGDLLLNYRRTKSHNAKWRPRMDFHHQPPASKAGALRIALQGRKWIRQLALHQSLIDTSDVRRSLRFGGIEPMEMVGHVRIARLLSDPNGVCGYHNPCPNEAWWSHADLHRDLRHAMTLSYCWTMTPTTEMVAQAGLAPAFACLPDKHLDTFDLCAMNWTRAPVLHRVIRICSPMARRLRRARDDESKLG